MRKRIIGSVFKNLGVEGQATVLANDPARFNKVRGV